MIAGVNAQPVKLKTIRTEYGNINGQTIVNLGQLNGADINLYALSNMLLLPVQVNQSADTFPVNCALQQCYEIYFFSSDDDLMFSLGQKSPKNRLREAIMPGDTCYLSMLGLDMLSIKAYLEDNDVPIDSIAYWKLIVGFCYSDIEGDYPTKKFYAGTDTCTFIVSCGSDAVQKAVKLRTIHTDYCMRNGSSSQVIGNLDGAVINPDSVSTLATQMYIVNTSEDTYMSMDKFRQTIIFLCLFVRWRTTY